MITSVVTTDRRFAPLAVAVFAVVAAACGGAVVALSVVVLTVLEPGAPAAAAVNTSSIILSATGLVNAVLAGRLARRTLRS